MSKDLIVVCGDMHAGSTVALCPPTGVFTDDGNKVQANRLQKVLYKEWRKHWDATRRLQDEEKPDTSTLILMGATTDAFHHGTPQTMSPNDSIHVRIAVKCLEDEPLTMEWTGIHAIRGTGVHVGGDQASLEEGMFRVLRKDGHPFVDDPDFPRLTSPVRRVEIGGLLVDARHTGRMGQRARTVESQLVWYRQDIEDEHRLDEVRPPDLALRAHLHRYGDSNRGHRWKTRVIQGPCWKGPDSYSAQRGFESMPTIGMYCIMIRDGRDEVIPMLMDQTRARPTIVRVS